MKERALDQMTQKEEKKRAEEAEGAEGAEEALEAYKQAAAKTRKVHTASKVALKAFAQGRPCCANCPSRVAKMTTANGRQYQQRVCHRCYVAGLR